MTAVRLLGPVTLTRDGSPVPLTAPMQRALVAYLALAHDHAASRDQIVDALWITPPPSAANLVQQYVAGLRRKLGAEDIVTTPYGYQLLLSEGVDAHELDLFVREAEASQRDGDFERARDQVNRALALWRGDALTGLPDSPFIAPERARLEHQLRRARLLALSVALERGDVSVAVTDAELLASDFPLDEEAAALLIRALAGAGRAGDALAAYERVRRALDDELGLEPGERLRATQSAVLRQDPALTLDTSRLTGWAWLAESLPNPLSRLVGRAEELESVDKTLSSEGVRLLTILGPGGVGKTRFAIEVATRVAAAGRHVAFVHLDRVSTADEVWPAVAETLRIKPVAGVDLMVQISRTVRLAGLVLMIDNFEHVIAASSEVTRLISMTPASVQVIVTSREALHSPGEHVFALAPLGTAGGIRGEAPAAQLFCQRAEAAGRDVECGDLAAVDEICRRLDGLPLAIELAAARSTLLPPAALLARLQGNPDVLTSRDRGVPQRQHSLQECLAWSVGLLSVEERRTLCCISVFQGTAAIEDVEAVVEAMAGQQRALELVEGLVHKSLLTVTEGDTGPRVGMLQVIRTYAAELLEGSPDRASARTAHALHYAQRLARRSAVPWPPRTALEFQALKQDLPNARVAMTALAQGGRSDREAELLLGVIPALMLLGSYDEATTRLDLLLASGDLPPGRTIDLLYYLTVAASFQGKRERVLTHLNDAFELLAAYPDDVHEAGLCTLRGNAAEEVGDHDLARACFARAREAAQRTNDPEIVAYTHTAELGGEFSNEVQKRLRAALRVAEAHSNEYLEMLVLNSLSEAGLCSDDPAAVAECISWGRRAYQISVSLGYTYGAALGAGNAGAAMLLSGRQVEAVVELQAAMRLSAQLDDHALTVENMARLAAAFATHDLPRAQALFYYWEHFQTAYGFDVTPSNQLLIDRFLSRVEPRPEQGGNPDTTETMLADAVNLALADGKVLRAARTTH